jgi:anti-anti-sigma factor
VDAQTCSGAAGLPAACQIVTLPDEIDMTNAGLVEDRLRAAVRPGIEVVIADMSATTFADSSAVRALLSARSAASAGHSELRLVIVACAVLRILQVMGLDKLLLIYPSVPAALPAAPPAVA